MSVKPERIRVLFLADAVFADLPGGSRVAARELAAGLAQRGHDVTFLVARQTPDAPGEEKLGPIRIIRYEGAGLGAEFVRRGHEACEKLCSETSFDVVHTHFAYASLGPLRAVPKSVPRVRTFHGPWDEEGWLEESRTKSPMGMIKAAVKRRMRYGIESGSLKASQIVLTLSDCFAQMARERYKVRSGKIQIIPGGVDISRFCLPADKTAVLNGLGLPEGRFILFTVRRLAPRMGLDNLIKAMASVVERHPKVLLLIGGKGPERKHLEAMVKSLGLESHVRLIGFIPDEELVAHYQASDLFIIPSIALEGFGLVITEALACGVPVVGTPVGAIPEILTGLDPLLVATGTDPASMALAIDKFIEGYWTRHLSPQLLRKYVEDKYTWDRHVEAVESVYRKVLKEPAFEDAQQTRSPEPWS